MRMICSYTSVYLLIFFVLFGCAGTELRGVTQSFLEGHSDPVDETTKVKVASAKASKHIIFDKIIFVQNSMLPIQTHFTAVMKRDISIIPALRDNFFRYAVLRIDSAEGGRRTASKFNGK